MNQNSVDVSERIDEAPISGVQKAVIALCVSIAIIDGFDAQSIGFVAPAIADDWGVELSEFGAVFSSGLIGMMLGGMLFGPVSDRFGRRRVIIGCAIGFGLLTMVTSQVSSVEVLMVLRFLTGLGLGGITPNLIALAAEFAPKRIRTTVVTAVVCAFSVGGFIGGFIAAGLIPSIGWRALFILGGVVPLVIAGMCLVWLPESVRFLTVSGDATQAMKILRRIDTSIPVDAEPRVRESAPERSSLATLFTDGRSGRTLLLWSTFFMNLLVIYFVLSWMPSLFGKAGLTVTTALIATSMFNLGGVIGGLSIGRLADRRERPFAVISTAYVIGAVFIGVTALTFQILPVMLASVFLIGVGVSGSQTGISAVAAGVYPTAARATGVGWAYGIGRIGSIVGPAIGGLLIAVGMDPVMIFALTIIPTLAASVSIMMLAKAITRRDRRRSDVADRAEMTGAA